MSRRRGIVSPPPPPYAGAETGINNMERAVIYRSVEFNFTAEDVLDCLFPADIVEKLRAAVPHAHLTSYASHGQEKVIIDTTPCTFNIAFHDAHMIRPAMSPVLQDAPKIHEFMSAVREIIAIKDDFDIVRGAVKWFNEKRVTPGCARYYFPGLAMFLPSTHPIHQTDGQRFKPSVFDGEITALLRKAPEIITKGMLADPEHNCTKDNCRIKVQIDGGQWVEFV